MNLEREAKLSVGPLFRMPDLSDLADGIEATGAGAQRFVTSYHDTDDLRLARWGVSLRYRTGEGWTVKLPGRAEPLVDVLAREEHVFDSGPGRPPTDALDLVKAFVRSEPVSLAVRLQTVRRRTELVAHDGHAVGEVVDDEVSVLDGRRVVGRFRELEVELVDGGGDEVLAAAVDRLRDAGADPSNALPKHVRALQPRATEPPDVPTVHVGRHATVAETLRAALSASAARLIMSDPVVRLGEDTEGVHQARVAVRRFRSDLRTFRSLLDPERSEGLREELSWLGDELGAVRDLDVLDQRVRAHVASLPDDDSSSAPKLLERLRVQRDEARAALLSAMREDRYVALLDRVVATALDPPLLPEAGEQGAADVVGDVMLRPWSHLADASGSMDARSAAAELHKARIRAKRVRYAAEALLPVAPKRARRFVKRASELQDVLGEHQDSVVAVSWLREQAAGTTSRAAFAAGELAGMEGHLQEDARRRWPKAWKALRDDSVRFWS